jgi:hypothetical protein
VSYFDLQGSLQISSATYLISITGRRISHLNYSPSTTFRTIFNGIPLPYAAKFPSSAAKQVLNLPTKLLPPKLPHQLHQLPQYQRSRRFQLRRPPTTIPYLRRTLAAPSVYIMQTYPPTLHRTRTAKSKLHPRAAPYPQPKDEHHEHNQPSCFQCQLKDPESWHHTVPYYFCSASRQLDRDLEVFTRYG